MNPKDLWNETKTQAGISKEFFDNYFQNRKVAYAYRLGKVKVYKESKALEEFGLRCAPQSFAYVR